MTSHSCARSSSPSHPRPPPVYGGGGLCGGGGRGPRGGRPRSLLRLEWAAIGQERGICQDTKHKLNLRKKSIRGKFKKTQHKECLSRVSHKTANYIYKRLYILPMQISLIQSADQDRGGSEKRHYRQA